jgi:hypothetical protein
MNVRTITAMNAISLANKLALTTRAILCLMFTSEIIAAQGHSPVEHQQSK